MPDRRPPGGPLRRTPARAGAAWHRRPPAAVVAVAVLGAAFLLLPFAGLLQRTPWRSLPSLLATDVVGDALRLSLITSTLATAVCLLLGLPLAWVLARTEARGVGLLRALVTLPMVLPPVVGGAALLFALGRRGLVGEPLGDTFGLVLPFSTAGVVLAQAFVAMPFLIVTVEGALRTADPRLDDVAATLGADRWTTFRRVTVPGIAPSLAAGTALCWARALGEFGATITFAGNLQGRTQTLPLAVYLSLERDRDAAIALSLLLIAVALAVLVAFRRQWWGPATGRAVAGPLPAAGPSTADRGTAP
jgi:molybdate transport system permease protein